MFGKGNDGSCCSSCLENQLLDCLRSREVWDAAFVFKEEKRSRALELLLLLLVDMTNYYSLQHTANLSKLPLSSGLGTVGDSVLHAKMTHQH